MTAHAVRPGCGRSWSMIPCWRQIYGLACMAVCSHLAMASDNYVPLFNRMLLGLARRLGSQRRP